MLFLSIMTAALVMGSCSNDEFVDEPILSAEDKKEVADNDVKFDAMIVSTLLMEPEEGATVQNGARRVAYNTTTGKISQWFDNDQISITDGVLSYTYKATATEGSGCSFTSITNNHFTTDEAEAEENEFDAFYPAAAVLGWNNGTVTTMIYTDQDYVENLEGSGVMGPYMAAHATTTDGGQNAHFEFMNIASIIDVNIADLGLSGNVKSVSIYANNQVSIAGKVQYNTGNKRITVPTNDGTGYSYSTQSETVTVSEINKSAAEAGTVRFYVLPIKIVGGVTITIRMEDGTYYSKHTTNDVGSSTDTEMTQTGVNGGTIVKPYYKKYNFGAYNQTGITKNDWMGTIPGNVRFSMLSIPGTHDAATSSTSSVARTQSLTIAQQLEAGVRALDLRPGFTSSNLEIFHGLVSTGVTLSAALDATKSFLKNHPTETVFILIHEEDNSFLSNPHSVDWSNRVWSCLNNYTDIIASAGWKSTLNACRGKMVVIFRDEYTDGTNSGDLGCGKVGWGSNWDEKTIMNGAGSKTNSGYSLWYQDIYEETNYNDKETNLVRLLTEFIQPNASVWERLYVNNVNMTGSSSLSTIANEMNQRVVNNTAFNSWNGRFCLMFADFVCDSNYNGDDIYHFIRNQNYKYVYTKRTRHTITSGTDTGAPISGDEEADDSEVYVKQRK